MCTPTLLQLEGLDLIVYSEYYHGSGKGMLLLQEVHIQLPMVILMLDY